MVLWFLILCMYNICMYTYVYAFVLRLFTFFSHVGKYHKNFLRIQRLIYISMNITKESCISRARDTLPLLLWSSCRQFSKTNFEECSILSNTSCSNSTCNHVIHVQYIHKCIHVRKNWFISCLWFWCGPIFDICAKNLVPSCFQVIH